MPERRPVIITVDSNILLSIFIKDNLYDRAASLIEKYSSNEYIINDAIYLELAVHFGDLKRLRHVLNILEITLLSEEKKNHAIVLGAWTDYLKNRKYHCQDSGKIVKPICPKCQAVIRFRQSILTDFLIGGFAQKNSDGILTFDTRYYRNCLLT